MVEVSDFCVILKDLPQDVDDNFVLSCLKQRDETTCKSVLRLQSHEEKDADKRWIVLLRSKGAARTCIQQGPWQVKTEKYGKVTIVPDYCSECIIPDEWEEDVLFGSESQLSQTRTHRLDEVGHGQKTRSDLVPGRIEEGTNVQDSESSKFIEKGETEGAFGIDKKLKIPHDSIRSADLFGSQSGRPVSSGQNLQATTLDNQRSNEQCPVIVDKVLKVPQDSVRSADLFGSFHRAFLADEEYLAGTPDTQEQTDRNHPSEEFKGECDRVDDGLDNLKRTEILKDETLRGKVKSLLIKDSKGASNSVAKVKVLEMAEGVTDVKDGKLKNVGIPDGEEVPEESSENGLKMSSSDDKQSTGFDASLVSMAHRQKYEKHHQFQQMFIGQDNDDVDQTKSEDESIPPPPLPQPPPSACAGSQKHSMLPVISSVKGQEGQISEDHKNVPHQMEHCGTETGHSQDGADVEQPFQQTSGQIVPAIEDKPPPVIGFTLQHHGTAAPPLGELTHTQSPVETQDNQKTLPPGHPQSLLSQSPPHPEMSGDGLQQAQGPNSGVYLLAQVPAPTTTAPPPPSHQQVYSCAYASSPNPSPAEPLSSNVVTDDTYMVPRPSPCRISTVTTSQSTPHSPGQPGLTSQSTPQSPLQPAVSDPAHRELPPIPHGVSNPTYIGHPPKPHAFANPEYPAQSPNPHAIANPMYMTNNKSTYYDPNAIPTASGLYARIETIHVSPTPHETPVDFEYGVSTPQEMTTVSVDSEISQTGSAFIQSKPGKLIDPLHILDISSNSKSENKGKSFGASGTYIKMGDVKRQMSKDYISMDGEEMQKIREEIRASQGRNDEGENDQMDSVEMRHENTDQSKPSQIPQSYIGAGYNERKREYRRQRSQSLDLEAALEQAGGSRDRTKKIAVWGINPNTSKEMLELFFENKKRCSGGDIQKVEFNQGRRQAVITYKNAQVAKNVVSRGNQEGFFTLEGAELSVDLYVPPPVDKQKTLVRGIHPKASEESLMFYLQKNCDTEVVGIVLGETAGTALVTFKEEIDLEALQSRCKDSSLEDCNVSIEPVQSTNCVLVTGLPPSVTTESLGLYFENRRRSMGMDVTEVRLLDAGTALVYFLDYRVAEQVIGREHAVCNTKLEVSLYYECLGKTWTKEPVVRPKTSLKKEPEKHEMVEQPAVIGISSVANEPSPKLRLPAPVDFPEFSSCLIEFIFCSEQYKKKFEEEVAKVGGCVEWLKKGKDMMVVSSSKMDQASVEAWESSVVDTIRSFLNVFTVAEISVAQEVWKEVAELMKQLDVKYPKEVSVFLQNKTCMIALAGQSTVVKTVKMQVMDIVNKTENKLQESKTTMTKKETLKMVQCQLLWAAKFPKTAESKFKGVKVELEVDRRDATFIGLAADVNKAMVLMHETLNSFMSGTFPLSKPAKDLLSRKTAREYLEKKLSRQKVLGVWDVVHHQDELVMYGNDEKEVRRSISIVRKHLKEGSIKTDRQRYQMLESKEWESLVEELRSKCEDKFHIVWNVDSIVIVGTVDVYDDGLKEIEKFFELHILREELFPLEKGVVQFMREFKNDKIQDIETQFRVLSVELIPEDKEGICGFRIKGKKDGCKLASVKLKDLVKSVQKSQHSVKAKPGVEEFFTSPEGVNRLKNIEHRNKCVIELDLESRNKADKRMSKPEERVVCNVGNHKIVVMAGDMTELHVDVMVNAANSQLGLGAGKAGAIFEKGGERILQECDDIIKHLKRELADGEIATTGPGNLSCKLIVHAVAPVWKGGHSNEIFLLARAVQASLEATDSGRHSTIALPAIGAGSFGFPIKEVTQKIVETIDYYFSNTGVGSHSRIQTIYLCNVKEETVKSFHAALDNQFGTRFKVEVVSRRDSEGEEVDTSSESDYEDEAISPDEGEIFEEEEEVDRGGTRRTSASDQREQNIKISVVKGELAKHQADVIVNSTNENLELHVGAISRSILKEGGDSIQRECKKLNPQGIKHGQLALTSGGNLKCSNVYHGCLKVYDKGQGASLQLMQDLVTLCLSTMEKSKHTSIAFPALGTGVLGFPADLVARVMFEVVLSYRIQNPYTCIRNVDFVIYPTDAVVFKAFVDAKAKYQPAEGDTGTSPSISPKSRSKSSRSASSQSSMSSKHRRIKSEKSASTGPAKDVFPIGSVSLEILQGDITKEKADVIVNSVLPNVDLSQGTLSKAIFQAAGSSIAGEWKAQDIEKQGYTVTSGGLLQCQSIFHVCARQSSGWWENIVCKCLEETDRRKYKSISFPALGTGAFGKSVDKVASAMFNAVKEFGTSGHVTHLRKVRFVVFCPDMVSIFIQAAKGTLTIGKGWQRQSKGIRDRVKSAAAENAERNIGNIEMQIYCDSRTSTDSIKMDIDDLREQITSSKIVSPMETIMNLRQRQVEEMQTMGAEDFVMVDINNTLGWIEISGDLRRVMKVKDKIEAYLCNIEKDRKKPHRRRNTYQSTGEQRNTYQSTGEQRNTYLPTAPAQLRYNSSQQTTGSSYPSHTQTSGHQSPGTHSQQSGGDSNLPAIQSPLDGSGSDLHSSGSHQTVGAAQQLKVGLPEEWSAMGPTEHLKLVELEMDSPEYNLIARKFINAAVGANIEISNIVQIERVQNPSLYRQFTERKTSMQTRSSGQQEKALWYGAHLDMVATIKEYGFRLIDQRGGTHGIYFQVNATTDSGWSTCPADAQNGHRHIFLAKVFIGDVYVGNQGMRAPPPKSPGNPADTFDSICDNIFMPTFFVIFNDLHAYPHYHITFQ